MSYFCADSNGYLDDVASGGGLAAFRAWAHQQGGAIHAFIHEGHTYQPRDLADALDAASAPDGVNGTRQAILACARRADGLLILTDGTSDLDDVDAVAKDYGTDTRTIYFVRHGECDDDIEPERHSAWRDDVHLNENGARQSDALCEQFNEMRPLHIISSSVQRAMDCARIIAGRDADNWTSVTVTPEADWGPWKIGELLTGTLKSETQDIIDHLIAYPDQMPPGNDDRRETWNEFQARFEAALHEVLAGAPTQGYICIVTHSWNCLLLLTRLKVMSGFTVASTGSKPGPCSVFALQMGPGADDFIGLTESTCDGTLALPKEHHVGPSGGQYGGPSALIPPHGPGYRPPSLLPTIKDDSVRGDAEVFKGLVKAATGHHEPELRDALHHAWKAAVQAVSVSEVRAGIRAKEWDKVAAALARGRVEARMRQVVEPRVAAAYLRGVEVAARPLRRLGVQVRTDDDIIEKPGPRLNLGRMNPKAAEWASTRSATLVDEPADVQALIRDFVEMAVEDGFTVDEIADLLKDVIGLDARRGLALENYAAELQREGLRDAAFESAFDGRVAELLLSRAETIARTEIMMATNAGQIGLWQEAVDEGLLSKDMKKAWIVTEDETSCDECNALADADPVDIDETFDGDYDAPPAHPNCRCTVGLVEDVEKAVANKRWDEHATLLRAQADGLIAQAEGLHALAKAISEQKAPVVNVTTPDIHVEAPIVHVTPPAVHVAAPAVHVEATKVEIQAPPAPAVQVDVHVPSPPKKELVVERDSKTGRVKSIKEK